MRISRASNKLKMCSQLSSHREESRKDDALVGAKGVRCHSLQPMAIWWIYRVNKQRRPAVLGFYNSETFIWGVWTHKTTPMSLRINAWRRFLACCSGSTGEKGIHYPGQDDARTTSYSRGPLWPYATMLSGTWQDWRTWQRNYVVDRRIETKRGWQSNSQYCQIRDPFYRSGTTLGMLAWCILILAQWIFNLVLHGLGPYCNLAVNCSW